MSKESESKVMVFEVDLDEIVCPCCNLEGTLCFKPARTTTGRDIFQFRCCNPECFYGAFRIFIAIKDSRVDEWQTFDEEEDDGQE